VVAKTEFMLKMIANIETIVERHGGTARALEDDVEARPAILMAFLQIGETLGKIDREMLERCGLNADAKGAANVRNFIAHDYLGVDLGLVENIVREHLPLLKQKIAALHEQLSVEGADDEVCDG
jgi:uncharacterized protein with HEPN domain